MLRPRSLFFFSHCTIKTFAVSIDIPFLVPLLKIQEGSIGGEKNNRPPKNPPHHKELCDFTSIVSKKKELTILLLPPVKQS